MKNVNNIEINCYNGAFGSSIRIGVPSKELLTMLRDILQKLAEGSVSECRFHDLPFINLTGLKELNLQVVSHDKFSRKTVKLVNARKNPLFLWSNSLEGWEECVGLIDGLLESDEPGHQYLSEESIDDALIMIAYCES